MILSEIGKKSNSKFKKINRYLEENHGFKISSNADNQDIYNISKKIKEEITSLKCSGNTTNNSSEITKRLLVLEGLKHLVEYSLDIDKYESHPKFNEVVSHMVDYVVDAVALR